VSELQSVARLTPVAVALATFAALALTPAVALARSHRGACAAAHTSRARHAARSCPHSRGRSRSGHGGGRAAHTGAPGPHAVGQAQTNASCGDGGAPALVPAGEASCADGSEPTCADGASVVVGVATAGALCAAGEPPSGAGEPTCTIGACAFDSEGPTPPSRREATCGPCEAITVEALEA